jgi:RHS repeat-associated protein
MGELDANASNAKVRTYIWGLDLSGSLQGAGGVGALLKVTDYTSGTTQHFVAYDGNGNVAALVDAGIGVITARYEYGPFGEPLRATGSMGKKKPLRLSTKYTDAESGMVYYGYRYYNPSIGRWPNRDPIAERGGLDPYAHLSNNPQAYVDPLGLIVYSTDLEGCVLKVTISILLNFENDKKRSYLLVTPKWDAGSKAAWMQKAEQQVEGYFNNLQFKCFSRQPCCVCVNGIRVSLELILTEDPDKKWEHYATVVRHLLRSHAWTDMGSLLLDYNDVDSTWGQVAIVYEIGHLLGMKHPGQRLTSPKTPNSPEDYDADPKSLMGKGMTLRMADFNDAFCSKIESPSECASWEGKQ